MKKILLILSLASICLFSKAQIQDAYLSGTATCPAGTLSSGGTNTFLITTNRALVHSVQVSSAATGVMQLWDADNTNAPFYGVNYTNNTYWTRASYATNLVATYISPLTGTTNVFTNSGIFTYFVTNSPGTNPLPTAFASAFTANIGNVSSGLNLVFARGIVLTTTTNVNYSIGYTP